jgi:type IV secretory pathway VirB10-like protein
VKKSHDQGQAQAAVRHAVGAGGSTGITIAAGTPIQVSLTAQVSSEHVSQGDSWSGEVKEPVLVGNQVVIPAGSTVIGTVEGVKAAEKGSRAFLLLGVRSVSVNGNPTT